MDIITTAISTAATTFTLIIAAVFTPTPATSTPTVDAPVSATVTVTEDSMDAIARQVEKKMSEPVIMCGQGGLIPSNAPKCSTK